MDRPFYLRTEFWLTTLGALPGLLLGLAQVFEKAVGEGGIDPSNPLYPLFIKVSGLLIVVYTFSRQINKTISGLVPLLQALFTSKTEIIDTETQIG